MEVLSDCVDTWCNRDVTDKSILSESSYKAKKEVDERITILAKNTNRKVRQQNEQLHTLTLYFMGFLCTLGLWGGNYPLPCQNLNQKC